MIDIKQSTAITWPFFAHDVNGDGVTGLVDAEFTKRISKNGGAFAAMTVTITEMENGWYSLPLSTAHSDTLGALSISISHASAKRANLQFKVNARTNDDLATPTNITAATGITVSAIGANVITAAGIAASALNGKGDWNIGKTGYTLTATTGLGNQTANITGTISTVTTLTNLPAITAGWLTAAGIAASALNGKGDWNIGKTGYTLTATTGLGNQTANIAGSITSVTNDVGITQVGADKVWGTTTRVLTAGTNIVLAKGVGVTGFTDLSGAQTADAVWNALTASYGTAGTYGELIETNLDAPVSGATAPTAAAVADAVWDEVLSGHLTAGTTGNALNAAGAAGDPWTTALPGAYGAGSAGYIIGNNLDATVSSIAVVSTSSALNKLASGFTLTTGTVASGTYTDTFGVEQTYHQLQDSAGTLDAYYEFNIGSSNSPVSVSITGRSTSNNDNIRIMGYRWSDTTWVQVALIVGTNGTSDSIFTGLLFSSMVGSGANAGLVRIRVYNTGLTTCNTYVDQISVGYAHESNDILYSGMATAGATSTITLSSDASALDDFYKPALIIIHGGAGAGQARRVDTYVGSTRVATVATPWVTNPDATSEINIYPAYSVRVSDIDANVITAASIVAGALNGKGDWNIGKTGYTLTQAFPTNFASLAITGGGAVTAGTVSDKTGYALSGTQTFNNTGTWTGNVTGSVGSVTTAITLPTIPSNWITAAGIAAAALNGKGNWNIGKTGYTLTQAFPTNFSALSITAGGLVDITQAAADKVWGTAVRLLTAGTNIVLAKGVGVTGFNDIAATAIVSGGAITTSAGAVSTVTTVGTVTTLTNLPSIPAGWLTAAGITAGALNGKGDWNIGKTGYNLSGTQTFNNTGTWTGNLSGSVGSVTAAVTLPAAPTDWISAAAVSAAAGNKIADHNWRRGFAAIRTSSDGDGVAFRSGLGMMAKLVNRWNIAASTLNVYEEDDTTTIGTQAVTGSAGLNPINELDTV